MPDNSKKFHDFALKSILFKGRSNWYFCFLKTEKIAHVLTLLAQSAGERAEELADRAGEMPHNIAYLAAGEADAAAVLADVFSILSSVRMATTQGVFNKETGAILCKEYEEVAQRLVIGSHPSPFLTAEDFRIGSVPELEAPTHQAAPAPLHIKDIKDIRSVEKGQSERVTLILSTIRKNKQASIKDIAAVVKGCSEKTIQRELGSLIEQGLVRKVGERRWSLYLPA